MRVDGQHLSGAPEVGQRVVDDRDVDRADRTQVLGDHQIGVEVRQRALVEVVEVFARAHGGGHERVDRRGVEPFGQGAGRDDAPFAGLGRVVALEGHADHVVAGTDGVQDLGGGRQE